MVNSIQNNKLKTNYLPRTHVTGVSTIAITELANLSTMLRPSNGIFVSNLN